MGLITVLKKIYTSRMKDDPFNIGINTLYCKIYATLFCPPYQYTIIGIMFFFYFKVLCKITYNSFCSLKKKICNP